MVTGFKMRMCAMFAVVACVMSSMTLADARFVDTSYVSNYVAGANNGSIRLTGDTLKIYVSTPWRNVIGASIVGLVGGGLVLTVDAAFNDPRIQVVDALAALVCSGIGGIAVVGSGAYLAYVVYQVNKTDPYITLSSSGIKVSSGAEIAWRRIAKVETVESVSHSTSTVNIGKYGSVGSMTPIVTKYLNFLDQYGTALVTIVGDGWLALPFENLAHLADWYKNTYGV